MFALEFASQPQLVKVDLRAISSQSRGFRDASPVRRNRRDLGATSIVSLFRPPGEFTQLSAKLQDNVMQFDYEHSQRAATTLEVEAIADVAGTGPSSPLTIVRPSLRELDIGALLATGRFRALRVVASDGWNAVEHVLTVPPVANALPRLIAITPRRFFIDDADVAPTVGVQVLGKDIQAVPGKTTSPSNPVVVDAGEVRIDDSIAAGTLGVFDAGKFRPVRSLPALLLRKALRTVRG
jgi:hypothetical protein